MLHVEVEQEKKRLLESTNKSQKWKDQQCEKVIVYQYSKHE